MKIIDLNTIDIIDKFIKDNKPLEIYPSFSINDILSKRIQYNNIINESTPINSLITFATNAYGFTSYCFYKNSLKEIFIIVIYIDEIKSYYKVNIKNVNGMY